MNENGHEHAHAHDHASGVGAEVMEDHRRMTTLLAKLECEKGLESTDALLAELRELLVLHFAREEGEDGLVTIVTADAPRHIHTLQELMAEHGDILKVIDSLRERIKKCLAESAGICEDSGSLIEMLQSHEARENEIISDALYTDLGDGD